MQPLSGDERRALNAAIAALEDMSMVLDGCQPAQIGIDSQAPGARDAAERLRRAARILSLMREGKHRGDVSSLPAWWSPN